MKGTTEQEEFEKEWQEMVEKHNFTPVHHHHHHHQLKGNEEQKQIEDEKK